MAREETFRVFFFQQPLLDEKSEPIQKSHYPKHFKVVSGARATTQTLRSTLFTLGFIAKAPRGNKKLLFSEVLLR